MKAKQSQVPKYIVGVVLVVAVIGILSLLIGQSSKNLTGQAIEAVTAGSLPDLLLAPDPMLYVTGNALVFDTAVVSCDSCYANLTMGITNLGGSTVSGYSYSRGYAYFVTNQLSFASYSSTYLTLVVGDTTYITGKYSLTSPDYPFLGVLYQYLDGTGVEPSTTLNYTIDYSSSSSRTRTIGINESNELNNNGSSILTLDYSGLTFTEVDCLNDGDCSESEACEDYYCVDIGGECNDSDDCTDSSAPHCLMSSHTCVECTSDGDCADDCGCDVSTGTCVELETTTEGSSTYIVYTSTACTS